MINQDRLTTFYIVRHGESQFNVEGIMQGHVDSLLTERGEDQASKTAEKLRHIDFAAVFSSDLLRAKRTAEIVKLERKLAVKTTQALREQHYGSYEGKKIRKFEEELRELIAKYEGLADEQKKHFRFEEGFETDAETASRFITFLREVAVAYPSKTVLIVSHGDAIRNFFVHTGCATYDQLPDGSIDNCGYAVVQSDGVDFFIKETSGIYMGETKDI